MTDAAYMMVGQGAKEEHVVDMTPEQRDRTGAIVEKVQEIDWDGDIGPWIDGIVSTIAGLVAQDAMFVEFAQVIQHQANKWALAAWSEKLVPHVGDSGWSRLSERLAPYVSTPG